MDIKQRLREAHWRWWLPAAFFLGICLLPSGHIEASPGEIFRPAVWMAPMGWPLLAMGVLFAASAFSAKLRARPWQVLFLGAGASLLFGLVLVASSGSAALYSWELGTNLQNRILVDFELEVLAFLVLPMDILLAALSFFVLWVRHGKITTASFSVPGPKIPAAVPAPATDMPAAAPAPEPEKPAALPPQTPEMPVAEPVPPPGKPTETPAAAPGPAPETPAAGPVKAPATPAAATATVPGRETPAAGPLPAAATPPAGASGPAT
jgi:hypothetical protein